MLMVGKLRYHLYNTNRRAVTCPADRVAAGDYYGANDDG